MPEATIIRTCSVQSGYWQDRTTADFRLVDPETTVALLPVAAIEQHGPHLPLSTDAVINEGVVRAALALVSSRTTLLVLPALSVGLSPEHTTFPGTLSIADSTLADAWTDVGRSVARAGLRKLVILNTHGGQKALVDLVATRLRVELGMLVALANFRGLPHELAARNRVLGAEKPVGIGWRAEDLHPSGACGNAARADAAKGAKHLAHLADRLATLVAELAATPVATLK